MLVDSISLLSIPTTSCGSLARSTSAAGLTIADVTKLIADAIKGEREYNNKRFAHFQRQLSFLFHENRARAARELSAAAHAEDVDED